jgi:hypothetical protein
VTGDDFQRFQFAYHHDNRVRLYVANTGDSADSTLGYAFLAAPSLQVMQ